MLRKLFILTLFHLLAFSPVHAQTDIVVSELAETSQNLPWPQNMQFRLDSMMRTPLLDYTQLGLMVWDLTDDSPLFSYNHRQLLRPASTMKLVTAITALDQLGARYELATSLYYKGVISGHTLIGNLYAVGGMDPMFSNDDMRHFAESLKRLGVDSICGSLVTDVSMKDTLRWGEGWCWDDDNPYLSPLLVARKPFFAQRMLSVLAEAGIDARGVMVTEGTLPKMGTVLVSECRHDLLLVLQRMMKDSDNLYAESVFYQVAASSGHKPARAIDAVRQERALMERAGLNSARYRLADGSGLSLYNYLSAEAEVLLLRYAYRNKGIYQALLPTLPVSSVDGTLKKRMQGSSAAGRILAKTGTVSGISALAGYTTAPNGHLLCFSIINQGVMRSADGRDFQDEVCKILCE